ncbi:MAG: TetR family transcriptional regulator [Ruminococcaceae bacterium]|nr:TetR family transcriptional regulator [Oscillospiraceae bacterium]
MLKLDTKQVLADALVELCRTKPLDKITVQNITDFCGAGRQTFYNHFKDKEELIEYIYLCDRKRGAEIIKKEYSLKKHMKMLLDICTEKRAFYVYAYAVHGQNSLSESVFKAAVDYYTNLVIQKGGKEAVDDEMEMAIRFNCYGDLCCVKDWIKKEIRCSSEKLAEIMIENMPERLKKYLD